MFDHIRFLNEKFTNPDGVIGLLSLYRLGYPKRDTIRKWFERGGIPSDWLPLLIAVLELDSGEPVRLAPYLTVGDQR